MSEIILRLSFILSTYIIDRYNDTIKCLLSILEQDYKNKEIFLVLDNQELYQKYEQYLSNNKCKEVKILINKDGGLSNARNMGIKNSTGDIIIFVDDDAYSDKSYIENLVKNYKDPEVIAVGGKVMPQGYSPSPEEIYWIEGFTYKGYPEHRCTVRNLLGCNMSFRKYIFDFLNFDPNLGKVGGNFITDEETEFCIRIASKFPDKKIIYDPNLVVYHKTYKNRQKLNYILRSSYNEGVAKAYIAKCHENDSLSTESNYLNLLLKESIPNKLLNIIKCKDIKQNVRHLYIILFVILSVAIGYISYNFRFNK